MSILSFLKTAEKPGNVSEDLFEIPVDSVEGAIVKYAYGQHKNVAHDATNLEDISAGESKSVIQPDSKVKVHLVDPVHTFRIGKGILNDLLSPVKKLFETIATDTTDLIVYLSAAVSARKGTADSQSSV